MISNSVTHLRSYTNSAIANIAGNPRIERRHLCIERRYWRIEWWAFRDVSQCFKYFMMFHNVLRVFHDVLLVVHNVLWNFTMYHNVLQVFHDVLLRLTMFSKSRNDQDKRPPIASGVATMPHGSVNPQKSAMMRRDHWYCRESDPMLNSVLNGDWSNSVPGRQFPNGFHHVLLCLTMFYDVQRVAQRLALLTACPPIASGNPQKSPMMPQWLLILPQKWSHARMENWNQDLPERYSKFRGLYIKFQGYWKWPWTWWGPWKRQGHWRRPPGHRKWRKACINTCKHILKFSNCVLLRVQINNNNYEQPIALFVIIPAKNIFTNQYGVI